MIQNILVTILLLPSITIAILGFSCIVVSLYKDLKEEISR